MHVCVPTDKKGQSRYKYNIYQTQKVYFTLHIFVSLLESVAASALGSFIAKVGLVV